MARFRSIKNNFLGGQIAGNVLGRTDLPNYAGAVELMRNAIPYLSGGCYRRPGTFFDYDINATTDYAPRLLPFLFGKGESYCARIGQAVGGSGSWNARRMSDNINVGADVSTAGVTFPYRYASAGGTGVLTYDEWHDIQVAQLGGVQLMVHPLHMPHRVIRTGVDAFSLSKLDTRDDGATVRTTTDFRDSFPYQRQNSTATTMSINTATVGTGRTLTASAATFTGTSADVGRVFKVNNAGTYGCCRITAAVSTTQATVEVLAAFGAAGTPVTTWWESAWSDYLGWPRAVAIFQNRAVYMGNATFPDTLWFSEQGDIYQLSHDSIANPFGDPTGSQGFSWQLASNQLNLIQWGSPGDTLTIGTSEEEWIMDSLDRGAGFSLPNAVARLQSSYGSAYHQPARFGNELFFIDKSERQIRALVYSEAEQSYVADPVQVLFDDYPQPEGVFARRKLKSIQWDKTRSTLWCLDTAGNFFGMTHERRLGVTMWHTHQFGGYDESVAGTQVGSGSSATLDPYYPSVQGSVGSFAVVPNPVLGFNDVFVLVKRKINNVWRYHSERIIGGDLPLKTAYKQYGWNSGYYLTDSSIYSTNDYSASEDFDFSGLDHLVAEEPVGVASSDKGLFVVSGGTINGSGVTEIQPSYPPNFEGELYVVTWGLPFDTIVKPVRIEAGSQVGSAQGAVKRIHEAHLRFYKTMFCKVGRSASNLETLEFREGSTPMQNSVELFTGDKRVKIDGDYDRDGYLYILQDQPLPFAIVSVSAEGQTYDG